MTTTGISRTPYLPAELRIPIYRAYNLSNKWFLRHPRQTFYKGAQLDPQASVEVGWGQSYVSVSDDSSTGDTACSALTLAEIGLHPREYSFLMRDPLMNEHIFMIDTSNINNLATWRPPPTTPIGEIQRVVLRMAPTKYEEYYTSALSVQQKITRIQNFLFDLTSLRHLRISWDAPEHRQDGFVHVRTDFGRLEPHVLREVSMMRCASIFHHRVGRALWAGCPKLETLVISVGGLWTPSGFTQPMACVLGASRGMDGRVKPYRDFWNIKIEPCEENDVGQLWWN